MYCITQFLCGLIAKKSNTFIIQLHWIAAELPATN